MFIKFKNKLLTLIQYLVWYIIAYVLYINLLKDVHLIINDFNMRLHTFKLSPFKDNTKVELLN